MQNTDWGKLFARLFSVYFFVRAVAYLVAGAMTALAATYAVGSQTVPQRSVGYLVLIVPAVAMLVIAVLLWVFAGKFAPMTEPSGEADPLSFGMLVLCALAVFLFFEHAGALIFTFVDPRRINNARSADQVFGMVWNAFVSLACAGFIVYARRVTAWILR